MTSGDFPVTGLETRADWGYTTKDNLSNTIKVATTFNIGASSLTLTSSSAFPAQGYILVDSEICFYGANNTGTGVLSSITRALQGTTEADHAAGIAVYLADSGGSVNRMAVVLEAILAKLGKDDSAVTSTIDYLVKTSNAANQEAWQTPTLLNSWANYANGFNDAGYMKDNMGFVHLRGLIKDGSLNSAAFTLPAGYRPTATELIATVSSVDSTTSVISRVDIGTNGNVTPKAGGVAWFSLDNITFRAA